MRVEKELIRALLKREGVTQTELARRLGKSKSCVNSVLTQGRSMLVSDMVKYADALGYKLVITAVKKED